LPSTAQWARQVASALGGTHGQLAGGGGGGGSGALELLGKNEKCLGTKR